MADVITIFSKVVFALFTELVNSRLLIFLVKSSMFSSQMKCLQKTQKRGFLQRSSFADFLDQSSNPLPQGLVLVCWLPQQSTQAEGLKPQRSIVSLLSRL